MSKSDRLPNNKPPRTRTDTETHTRAFLCWLRLAGAYGDARRLVVLLAQLPYNPTNRKYARNFRAVLDFFWLDRLWLHGVIHLDYYCFVIQCGRWWGLENILTIVHLLWKNNNKLSSFLFLFIIIISCQMIFLFFFRPPPVSTPYWLPPGLVGCVYQSPWVSFFYPWRICQWT